MVLENSSGQVENRVGGDACCSSAPTVTKLVIDLIEDKIVNVLPAPHVLPELVLPEHVLPEHEHVLLELVLLAHLDGLCRTMFWVCFDCCVLSAVKDLQAQWKNCLDSLRRKRAQRALLTGRSRQEAPPPDEDPYRYEHLMGFIKDDDASENTRSNWGRRRSGSANTSSSSGTETVDEAGRNLFEACSEETPVFFLVEDGGAIVVEPQLPRQAPRPQPPPPLMEDCCQALSAAIERRDEEAALRPPPEPVNQPAHPARRPASSAVHPGCSWETGQQAPDPSRCFRPDLLRENRADSSDEEDEPQREASHHTVQKTVTFQSPLHSEMRRSEAATHGSTDYEGGDARALHDGDGLGDGFNDGFNDSLNASLNDSLGDDGLGGGLDSGLDGGGLDRDGLGGLNDGGLCDGGLSDGGLSDVGLNAFGGSTRGRGRGGGRGDGKGRGDGRGRGRGRGHGLILEEHRRPGIPLEPNREVENRYVEMMLAQGRQQVAAEDAHEDAVEDGGQRGGGQRGGGQRGAQAQQRGQLGRQRGGQRRGGRNAGVLPERDAMQERLEALDDVIRQAREDAAAAEPADETNNRDSSISHFKLNSSKFTDIFY
ncbi:hypothetical protein KUF71_002535 [Frankliniella fusca]|uniref:Uncharacterized protein n=1 Tax=Frankliniella fusca TaxID=407009 RepID=A0AAE1HMW1_9NEOP|nr:hypothetical protein KUF71_002535 [Frankliniella fusca]